MSETPNLEEKYLCIPINSTKEIDALERKINLIKTNINAARVSKEKENIVRLFLASYRNICTERPEITDLVSISNVISVIFNAIEQEQYVNGAEYRLMYNSKSKTITVEEDIRALTCKYTEKNNLELFKEAFTKKAIEYITENNMKMPIQMSELPASITIERPTILNLHGINISFVKTANGEIERARYYTVEELCAITKKTIKDGVVHEKNGNRSTNAWTEHPLEMFKKTALRNIMKDVAFF